MLILRHHFPDAFSVLFTYLIAVKIIENFRGKPKDFGEAISVYGSSFIAAAALTFSDTMWFNSVESEVYATSLTFVALIVWLMMKRNEKADDPGHERYLLLIAYFEVFQPVCIYFQFFDGIFNCTCSLLQKI